MAKRRLKVIPLGGVGEIGKNATIVQYVDDMLLVDSGVKFPEEEMHGIDLVIPDFGYAIENQAKLRAILLTHGHEDHIGALPYLLPRLSKKVRIFGSPLTCGLAAIKLREKRVLSKAELHPVSPGDTVRLGRFQVEFLHVNHSIPDATALAITSPVGTLVHTGDFKFDETPVDGRPTDFGAIRRLGEKGILVLLSDCTRVEQRGRTPSERIVGRTVERIMAEAPGRVIVTTFASNLTRVQQLILAAHRLGRKAAIVGRSLEQNVTVAKELGFIESPDETIVGREAIRQFPPDRLLIITTGSQGEPTSVLARLGADDYPYFKIVPGDTVIIAATPVPGNEETVSRTIDNLFRRGAKVIYSGLVKNIHVSGHASRDELKQMIEMLKPSFCVPVHGEYRHMVLYKALAEETGLPTASILLSEIGDVLEFSPGFGRKNGTVPTGSVLVDGLTVGRATQVVLRDRRRLAEDGVLIVSVAIDTDTGQLLGGPDIVSLGFIYPGEEALLERAKALVRRSLMRRRRGEAEIGFLVGKIKDILARFIYDETHRRPMILPVITEV